MQLILLDSPPTLAARLARMGWSATVVASDAPVGWRVVADANSASQLPAPRLWLSGRAEASSAYAQDVVLDVCQRSYQAWVDCGEAVLALALQDSIYAVEHGFFIAVGGAIEAVELAVPVLDALAPQPGGWLYAGGRAAPQFLNRLIADAGMSWSVLAAQMAACSNTMSITPWWQQQRTLLATLAQSARDYLAIEQDACYRPRADAVNSFPFFAPMGQDPASPARKIANLLCWLDERVIGDTAGSTR